MYFNNVTLTSSSHHHNHHHSHDYHNHHHNYYDHHNYHHSPHHNYHHNDHHHDQLTTSQPPHSWRYSSEEEIDGASVKGEVGSYDGGGYYTNLAASANESLQQIEELKQNLWIDRATRAVFVDFTIYNANMNYFCIIKLAI